MSRRAAAVRLAEGNEGASAAVSTSAIQVAESPRYPSQLLTARKQPVQSQRNGDCHGGNANPDIARRYRHAKIISKF